MIYPPIKMIGGKFLIRQFVLPNLPKHDVYIEGCLGGGSIFYNKQPSSVEILNEADPAIFQVHNQIQNNFEEFSLAVSRLTYSEETFLYYKQLTPHNNLDLALKELVLRRMSRSGLGKDFAASTRLRGGQEEGQNALKTLRLRLPVIYQRISRARLILGSVFDLIPQFNAQNECLYIDPPYVQSTRTPNLYRLEWSDEDHIRLANLCNQSGAKILISGYRSELYDEIFKGWTLIEKVVANHSGQNKKKSKRIECLWLNY